MNKFIAKMLMMLPPRLRAAGEQIMQTDIGRRIASGAFWSLLGAVFSQGLMLLVTILVARILGKNTFGELGIIRSTVNMFAVFAGFGLGMTATRYIAEYRNDHPVRTGRIIGLTTLFAGGTGALISAIILISAPWLATHTLNAPHLVNEIRLGAVMLFFSSLNGAQTGILAGFESFRSIARVSLLAGLLAFPLQIGLAWMYGLPGAVVGFGMNFILLWVMNFVAVRRVAKRSGVRIQYSGLRDEWPVLWKFSLPALMSGILVTPVMWVCNTMMVNEPGGYGEMALFDAANQWRNAILFIPAILSQIALPMLSGYSKDAGRFNRVLKINIWLNLTLALGVALVIALLSGLIMRSYGTGFSQGSIVLVILAFSTVLVAVNNVIGQAIAGKGRMWPGFILNLGWSVVFIVSSFLLLRRGYGATGLAFSLLISYAVHTINQTVYIHYRMKNDASDNDMPRMLYVMHVSWYWIKQRPHFLGIYLNEYYRTRILYPMSLRHLFEKSTTPDHCKGFLQLPFSRFFIIRKINELLFRRWVGKEIKKSDIVYFGHPEDFASVATLIPQNTKVVYDCMDDLLEFPGNRMEPARSRLFALEKHLVQRANVLVTSSQWLKLKLIERYATSTNIAVVNNALDQFLISSGHLESPFDYPEKSGYIDVMYVGTVSEWFDFDALLPALEKWPTLRLILIGPLCTVVPSHPRILSLGPRPHTSLAAYMAQADALIMPFVVNDLIRAVNPVKLYEYLTTDKPVITCFYDEIRPFGKFVHSYDNAGQCMMLLQQLIDGQLDAQPESERKQFLNVNTWAQRAMQIRNLLDRS